MSYIGEDTIYSPPRSDYEKRVFKKWIDKEIYSPMYLESIRQKRAAAELQEKKQRAFAPVEGGYIGYFIGEDATQQQVEPKILSMWPYEEATFLSDRSIKDEYKFGADALEQLKEVQGATGAYLDLADIHASLVMQSDNPEAIENVAQELQQTISVAIEASTTVTRKLLSDAGKGFADCSKAFSQIGSEFAAWSGGVPLPVQEKMKQYAFDWRDVTQAASEIYLDAERRFADIMARISASNTVLAQLYQRLGEAYRSKIEELKAQLEKARKDIEELRSRSNGFIDVLKSGYGDAQKVLKQLGLDMPSLGASLSGILKWGAIALGALVVYKMVK